MPPIVNGVDIGRKMSADEIAELHRSGRLQGITMKGYFWRHEMDGLGSWVHFTDPTANKIGEPGGGLRDFTIPDPLPGMKEAVAAESPIVRRTPQERVASLMMKLLQGGLTEDVVAKVMGESWKQGTPLAAEDIRRVAAHYLGAAEKDTELKLRETRGRAGRKARREQERLERQERKRWERQHTAM